MAPQDLEPAKVKSSELKGDISPMVKTSLQQGWEKSQQVEDIPETNYHT